MASIFSGSAGRAASQAGNETLMAGLKNSIGVLDRANNSAAGYLNQNSGIYQQSADKAQGLLNSTYQDAKTQMQGQADAYTPFYNTGVQANNAYANATGLNGAAGSAQAMQDFRTAPGYQFQMDQGLDAVNRNAAARGGLASGNNTVDLMRYAQGQADQGWQNHLGNLNNQVNTGMQAANGIANAKQGMASLAMNYGNTGAQLQQGLGDRLAGNNAALAGNEMSTGNTTAGMVTNATNQMAQNNAQGMMAGQQAASNRFGAVMGGIQSGMSLLGGLMM